MYVKLFATILDSSVWLESHATVRVWITFLAAKDSDGFCRFAALENLAHRARVSTEEAESAVAKLEAPDNNSSNPDHEGRRIERVPGGWVVLNAQLYNDMVKKDDERRSSRERVRKHRAKKADPETALATVEPFDTFWSVYPRRIGSNPKNDARKKWDARIREGVKAEEMIEGAGRYAAFVIATGKADSEYVMQAVRFLGPSKHYGETWATGRGKTNGATPGEASYRNAKDALDGL